MTVLFVAGFDVQTRARELAFEFERLVEFPLYDSYGFAHAKGTDSVNWFDAIFRLP